MMDKTFFYVCVYTMDIHVCKHKDQFPLAWSTERTRKVAFIFLTQKNNARGVSLHFK